MAESDSSSPTANIATWLTNLTPESIPASVHPAARRTLYNYLGCTIHGTQHTTFSRVLNAITPFSGPPTSSLLGTAHLTDAPHTTLLNGIASHIHDYDNTHLETIIHPAGPVASALLAYVQYLSQSQNQPTSGPTLLTALTAGIEVEGKLGPLGIAASQVVGLRCNFGSDTKCFHVGRAAQNGLLAACLAQQGFHSC